MFFDGYTANELIVGLVSIILVVMHELFPNFNLFVALKNKFGLEGNVLKWIVVGVFMALAALASYITGELDGVQMTLNALLEMFGWLYIPADIAYQMLKDQR
jgi:hypothetical protein